jgi:hypothetical protein
VPRTLTEEVAMGRVKEDLIARTEALEAQLNEIANDMTNDIYDGDVWDRLQAFSETSPTLGEALVMTVLNTAGTALVVAVTAAQALDLEPEEVITQVLPDVVRVSLMIGVVAGREHHRRGYSL